MRHRFTLLLCGALLVMSGGVYAQDNSGYRIGQGDRISIQVFDEDDLTMESTVGETGSINYSYLGILEVEGKTTRELEQQITNLLQDGYLVNPSVNVTITEYRPFFINGEVSDPGSYPYQPGLTLDKAIALAGGLTDRASKRKIYLIPAENPDAKPVKIGMKQSIDPGDVIEIKEGFF